MSKSVQSSIASCALLSATIFLGAAANAQGSAQIDVELADEIDFRATSFSACLNRTQCTVGNVTVLGERRLNDASEWRSAPIYWDPIDGIGIQDGAQNDEIDINERLLVRFADPQGIDRIWLSDLFINEDRRYGSSMTDLVEGEPEDAEIAGMSLAADGAEIFNTTISGESRLPWAQFNQEIDVRFREDGDLRRRIVVNDDIVTIVIPGEDLTLQTPVSPDDAKTQSLFEGLETVELDITDLLAEFNTAALFEVGTTNFELINAIAQDPDNIAEMIRVAQEKRTSIRMSNGEVSFDVDQNLTVDEITFFSPFDASNDFSIAGIVLRK